MESAHRKAVRTAIELEQLLTPAQLADLLPDEAPESTTPAPSVVRPVRPHRTAGAASAARAPIIDRLVFEDFDTLRPAKAGLRVVE